MPDSEQDEPQETAVALVGAMQLLYLGEAIAQLSLKTDPNPFSHEQIEEDSDSIRRRIKDTTRVLQETISIDRWTQSTCRELANRTDAELQLLALVAFFNFTNIHSHETVDSIALKASALLSRDRIKGMMLAREVTGKLLLLRALRLVGINLIVSRSIRFWIAGRNSFAQFNLCQQEVDHFKKSSHWTKPRKRGA